MVHQGLHMFIGPVAIGLTGLGHDIADIDLDGLALYDRIPDARYNQACEDACIKDPGPRIMASACRMASTARWEAFGFSGSVISRTIL